MSDSASMDHALARARRQRPAPLPRDFSATVLDQVARRGPATADFLHPPGLGALACAAMLAAASVSFLATEPDIAPAPPPLTVFGGQAGHSPFINP